MKRAIKKKTMSRRGINDLRNQWNMVPDKLRVHG
jgi:hypothetical protein